MIHHEHEFEAAPGLPERLPPGETILWQGAPSWRSLAHRVFHVRMVAIYCAILLAWRSLAVYADGQSIAAAATAGLWLAAVLLPGVLLLLVLAWLQARTTLYTITNRRVVMRYGVAFQIALNIPFQIIHNAGMKPLGNGFGDIALSLKGGDRMAYLALWPHARPGRYNPAEPTLRSIPDAEKVGQLLAHAAMARPEVAAPMHGLTTAQHAAGVDLHTASATA